MGLTPYSDTLANGARASDVTETYELSTKGRPGLIVLSDVSASAAGKAYLVSGALTLPVTIVAGVNDGFIFDGDAYVITPGTYATADALATAVGAAHFGVLPLSNELTVTAEDSTHLRYTAVVAGADVREFGVGTHDALVTYLKIADTAPLAKGADAGTFSLTVTVQGVDPVSGEVWTILQGAAITAEDTLQVLRVSPGEAVASNVSAADVLPSRVRVQVTHTTTASITRTHVVQLVG